MTLPCCSSNSDNVCLTYRAILLKKRLKAAREYQTNYFLNSYICELGMMENEIIHDTYPVKGMTCAACASSLESHLKSQNGVKDASVNFADNSAFIAYDPSTITLKNIQKAADDIGYHVVEGADYDEHIEYTQRLDILKYKLLISAVLTAPVFLISMFLIGLIPYENYILLVLSTPVLFWAGSEFFRIAWKKGRHLTTNMDTLVAMSTGTAYVFSAFNTLFPQFFLSRGLEPHVYYESATVIITLILLGRYFEEKAKYRTTGAIKRLMGIQPKYVETVTTAGVRLKPVAEVRQGEIITVKPGIKIALDGYVTEGTSYVDESMINGEPLPSLKSSGDYVYAGTLNQNGTLDIRVDKESGTTLLAQIIDMVRKAQASKPPIQKLVDKIAAVFVPFVIAIALLSFIIWYLAGPEPQIPYSFLVLITVLIIACPCALGLATPTALMVGIGKGAEMGILIKDAQSLETAHKIDTLVLDKTGTITRGKPEVIEVMWNADCDIEKEIVKLVHLESRSEHPLARSILDHYSAKFHRKADIKFRNIPGSGIEGTFDGHTYFAGNRELVLKHDPAITAHLMEFENKLLEGGYTLVYFGHASHLLCILGIRDPLRESAPKAIEDLQDLGIEIILLSGDNKPVTGMIAKELGIDNYLGEVLPDGKGEFIKDLVGQGKTVAMAGDGINDAQALAEADISIAMGSGTDIAMDTAGITLIYSDIQHIRDAIFLSKATVRTIHQNLIWAFAYNILAIPLAAGVLFPFSGFLLNPMIAGAAMAFSSVSVVANSLRLKKKKLTRYEDI